MYYQALVNKRHGYRDDMFFDREFVTTKNVCLEEVQLEKKTYDAYLKLKTYLAEKESIIVGILSGYRSLEEQRQVYEDFVFCYGENYAKEVVAPVGKSEHHTGLCIDLSIQVDGQFLVDNDEIMKNFSIYEKIVPSLFQFGFILRYPKGRENVTGYPYEAWHIRYVGKELASKLYQENLTLEEYYDHLSGVLVIDKEKGMTSRDVVNIVSRYFYTKKVGHTGTLDPLATGVLVLTIGKATRISELLTATLKEYIAKVKLGILTDTLDITGTVLKKENVPKFLPISEVLASFQKTYLQEVPIYSAVKVKGKKLYEYARENKEVILPKKEVTIQSIELLEQCTDTFTFRTTVSKGTYIRSLIRDFSVSLGISATMMELRRSRQGHFSLEQAFSLAEIKEGKAKLLTLEEALSNYPQIMVDEVVEQKVKNGQKLWNREQLEGTFVVLNQQKKLLAIYRGEGEQLLPWKVLTPSIK